MHQIRATIPWRRLSVLLVLVGLASALAIVTATPHATAEPPCAARYTLKNGVVLDNDTNLTWQQNFGTDLTFADAKSYCASLTLDGGGFRVPTIFELQTIVDESRKIPVIDDATFPGTPKDIFWSATPRVDPTDCANCNWYVNFGLTNYELVDTKNVTEPHYVRCVH